MKSYIKIVQPQNRLLSNVNTGGCPTGRTLRWLGQEIATESGRKGSPCSLIERWSRS